MQTSSAATNRRITREQTKARLEDTKSRNIKNKLSKENAVPRKKFFVLLETTISRERMVNHLTLNNANVKTIVETNLRRKPSDVIGTLVRDGSANSYFTEKK